MSDIPAKVKNRDVASVANGVAAYIFEIGQSASTKSNKFSEFDRTRINVYLDNIDTETQYFASRDMDLPRSHPLEYSIEELVAPDAITNQWVRFIFESFLAIHRELVLSTSSDHAAGISRADEQRVLALTEDVRNYMSTVIGDKDSIDMPESASGDDQNIGS